MTDQMRIEDYLAQGGVLTSPGNAPPRYRAELLRMMATFVDSELAGAAGFADMINLGPGLREKITAAQLVSEKLSHARQVLAVMGEFGADTKRYVTYHPWSARLPREADVGARRSKHDMRLAVFNYPLNGWTDAVAMNFLMGRAVSIQMREFSGLSYQPLADAFRDIAPREDRHAALAEIGLEQLAQSDRECETIRQSIAYWRPRVADSFGGDRSERWNLLKAFGLRKTPNADLRSAWRSETDDALGRLGF